MGSLKGYLGMAMMMAAMSGMDMPQTVVNKKNYNRSSKRKTTKEDLKNFFSELGKRNWDKRNIKGFKTFSVFGMDIVASSEKTAIKSFEILLSENKLVREDF